MQQLKMVKVGRVSQDEARYTDPRQVFITCRDMMKLDREHFVVLHMDGKNRIIARETVAIGSLNQATVHPREVFKAAVHNGSAALILVHNHPTGDPRPSGEDIAITNRLHEAGELIGIRILDHIIIGEGEYCSFISRFGGLSQESTRTADSKTKPPTLIPINPLSPTHQRFLEIKSDHPNALLLFHKGDTHEAYYNDALIASRLLELELSVNNEYLPFVSLPSKDISAYIGRLVLEGHKVAISELTTQGKEEMKMAA